MPRQVTFVPDPLLWTSQPTCSRLKSDVRQDVIKLRLEMLSVAYWHYARCSVLASMPVFKRCIEAPARNVEGALSVARAGAIVWVAVACRRDIASEAVNGTVRNWVKQEANRRSLRK